MVNTEDVLSYEISYQDNMHSYIKHITINNFLDAIKNERCRTEMIAIRYHRRNNNSEYSKQLKKNLPVVTFSGLFKKRRNIDSIIKYNKICVIDIDHISNESLNRLLLQFKDDPYIFAFWLSPSGDGIKGLVQFKFMVDVGLTDCRYHHKHAFSLLEAYIKEKYSIEMDNSGSDITRLCFISADKNLIIKKTAKEFVINNNEITAPIKKSAGNHNRRVTSNPSFVEKEHLFPKGRNRAECRYRIQRMIIFLKKRNLSITRSYDEWYKIAYAISDTFTYDLGKKYFLRLCELDGTRYNKEASIKMLQYCYLNSKHEIFFATIEHHFDEVKEEWGRRTEDVTQLCVS
jgi:hypothetical protein